MRIRYHYTFIGKAAIIRFLDNNQIPFETSMVYKSGDKLCHFDIYSDDPIYSKFKRHFPLHFTWCNPSFVEYDDSEIESAPWLFVRSMSKQIDWIFDESSYSMTCPYKKLFSSTNSYKHIEQIAPLTVGKKPKWSNRRYFSGPNAADDDLIFCSNIAKELLGDRWQGLEFLPVKNRRGTLQIDGTYQMQFTNIIPVCAFSGGKRKRCGSCGKEYIVMKDGLHSLQIEEKYFGDGDKVFQTGSILTDSPFGFPLYTANIVPQSFYQFCKKHNMNHGMIYEPVNLV